MKISKLLIPLGFASVLGCTIAPITSCSAKSTWEDSTSKKIKLILKQDTIQLDKNDKGQLVFDIDRNVSADDFAAPTASIENATVLESKTVENHTLTFNIKFNKSKFTSGTEFTFTITSAKYKVVDGVVKVKVIY